MHPAIRPRREVGNQNGSPIIKRIPPSVDRTAAPPSANIRVPGQLDVLKPIDAARPKLDAGGHDVENHLASDDESGQSRYLWGDHCQQGSNTRTVTFAPSGGSDRQNAV
jgi:hypothetical protein